MSAGRAGILLGVLAACGTPGPRPPVVGQDACRHCHMALADPRFAAELVTRTGRVLVFDDVGCLAAWIGSGGTPLEDIHSVWVADFAAPDTLIEAREAVFLATASVHTPMDYGIIALRPGAADSIRAELGGEVIPWEEVRGRVGAGSRR